MRTKEFIEQLRKMGYIVEETTNNVYIKDENHTYVHVSKNRYYQIKTKNNLCKLTNREIKSVMDLIVKYVSTPIEKREEPKKYYLKLPDFVSSDRYCYLNYKKRHKHYLFSDDEECEYYQTKFTQKEIDAMPNQEFIKTLNKREVKE